MLGYMVEHGIGLNTVVPAGLWPLLRPLAGQKRPLLLPGGRFLLGSPSSSLDPDLIIRTSGEQRVMAAPPGFSYRSDYQIILLPDSSRASR